MQKTGLPGEIFPKQCLFSLEDILNNEYFP
ncbi:hypothetical protein PN471_13315 [Aphanizomenon sp. CS-733/32]|nr:hypothetical protein [Aphanizomenon sp. CS-733/32]MDB9309592.1 hypothetical protein [Aphanizomenon sp. CS-733/32]